MQTHRQQTSCLNTSFFSCQEATSSAQQLGPQDFLWATTDTTQTHTSGSSFVASHRRRRRSKGASTWQISLKPCSTFLPIFPSDLAPILAFTLIYWNVPSSLTHSSLAAGRLFAGISDTPCPWITLGSREITAFCHLACQSLVLVDRRWMCQTGEQTRSEKTGGGWVLSKHSYNI